MPHQRATMQALRKVALRHPDTEEGVACAGTPVERRTVKARSKAFLFLGMADAMVKLRDSLPEAEQLSRADPEACRVGANGWVKTTFGADGPPLEMLARWVDESYQLAVDAPASRRSSKKKSAPAVKRRTP